MSAGSPGKRSRELNEVGAEFERKIETRRVGVCLETFSGLCLFLRLIRILSIWRAFLWFGYERNDHLSNFEPILIMEILRNIQQTSSNSRITKRKNTIQFPPISFATHAGPLLCDPLSFNTHFHRFQQVSGSILLKRYYCPGKHINW